LLGKLYLWKTFTSGGRYTEKMYWWYIAVSIIYIFLHSKFITFLYFEISSMKYNIVNIIIILHVLDSAGSLWTDNCWQK